MYIQCSQVQAIQKPLSTRKNIDCIQVIIFIS